MSVQVLYFASLKEALGMSGESVDFSAEVATVGALRERLIGQGRAALATAKNLRCAVNQEMVKLDAPVADGDEVAFFPPVTGG
ncbi:molybdopterin converting factor subunit 1 [Azonexus sp. IMCC34839]|uniref:molybdopterin converting factor subunit 1 n=1 Tax=Azonexus sp. IMCC34839 TaxID=3133695 RepID=UPI00399AC307